MLTSHVAGLPREEEIGGVLLRRLPAGRRRPDRCTVPEMAAYVALHAWPAIAEARRFQPDVIHAHFAVPTGPVAWLASLAGRVPFVITAHLGDVPGGVPEQTDGLFRLLKPFTVPIWRGARASTAVASHVADLAEAAYGVRPRTILNGIAMGAPPMRAPSSGPLRLIWCGRVQEQKNLPAGIAALAPLAGRDWTLEVVGDGPQRAEAMARAERAGLGQQVIFHSWMEAAEVEARMRMADALFLPSLSEGLSLVTVEALRAGLAFVASCIPGVTDVVADGVNGLLFDPGDAADIAAQVERLMDDRAMLACMQAQSLERRPAFDERAMIDAYEEVLMAAAGR